MMYPAIILSVMVIIGILMLIFVVPTLTATFTELDVDLPATTRLVIGASEAVKNYPVVFVGGLVIIIAAFAALARTKRGKRSFEWAVMRLPVIGGLVRETNTARMARTFSSLLSSGVEVVSALSITADVVQNSYYKEVFIEGETEIQKGAALSSVFAKYGSLFPPMVGEMVAVGEETGKLPSMLLQIATFFEAEVEQKTKDMSTIIEPLLMVVIGTAVGFFAISMITPIYSISSGL
jgi:type IV pilus assembly protein PilC